MYWQQLAKGIGRERNNKWGHPLTSWCHHQRIKIKALHKFF